MTSPIIISIEGNIGSGKSTILEELRNKYKNNVNIAFIKEPVDEWETIKDINNKTMLQKFYSEPTKYAFSFQMMAYISRLNAIKNTIDNNPQAKIFITERCLYTDKHVFALMLYKEDHIEEVDYQIYNKWFDSFAKDYPINKIIYINTNPNICYERIEKRSRIGENTIQLEYLSDCHKHHEIMIHEKMKNVTCLEINGDIDMYSNNDILNERLENINNFISFQ